MTPHDSTGMTPDSLMLGRENWFPIEVTLGPGGTSTGEPVTSSGKYVDGLQYAERHMK